MRPIERLKGREVLAQLRHVGHLEPVVPEPAAHECVDGFVMPAGRLMIAFQSPHENQRLLYLRVAGGAEAREQALLLVGRVVWRGRFEVPERALERTAGLDAKMAAGRVPGDGDEHAQKVLDSPVAVAQEPERLIETVVRGAAYSNGHDSIMTTSLLNAPARS